MGSKDSKEETKTVDTAGAVNNNLVFQEAVPIHSDQIVILMYIICGIKIVELLLFFYKMHLRRMKKRYFQSTNELN